MVDFLFGLLRLILGAVGAWWLLGGLWMSVAAASDHAWSAVVGNLVMALVGFGLAHSAFVRAPWEPKPSPRRPAP